MEKSDDDVPIVRFGAADDSVRSVRPSAPLSFRAAIGIAPWDDHASQLYLLVPESYLRSAAH